MGFLCASSLDFGSSAPWAGGGQQRIARLHKQYDHVLCAASLRWRDKKQ